MEFLFETLTNPYCFIGLLIFFIVIFIIIFYKRINTIFKKLKLIVKKTNIFSVAINTDTDSENTSIGITFANTTIENSETAKIEGNVSMKDVYIKDSTVGEIKGK